MSKLQPLNNSGQFQPGNAYRWQPGDTPNPGGNYKNTPHADAAYARLGSLPLEQLKAYEPKHAVEGAIKRSVIAANEASDWKEAHAALKQLILCLDGNPLKRQQVEVSLSEDTKALIFLEAYTRLFEMRSLQESVAAIERIYAAKDSEERRAMIQRAIDEDSAAIDGLWELSEKAVMEGLGR